MVNFIASNFNRYGLPIFLADVFSYLIVLVLLVLLCIFTYQFIKKYVISKLIWFIKKTNFKWDDILFQKKVFNQATYLVPAIIVLFFSSLLPYLENFLKKISLISIIIIVVLILKLLIKAALIIYEDYSISKKRPIKGYIQLIMIFIYFTAFFLILSILLNRSPWGLFAGLGAMTAVIVLVFKDSILGLVASFQLTSNKMLRIGDWIEMPQCMADGEVLELTLHTVKIRNWDKTITIIPAYKLISEAFRNWKGMIESGGRRIKRIIYIDINSICFCTEKMLNEFIKINLIKNYINSKINEIKIYNNENNLTVDDISARRLTNIGIFRAYILSYLSRHPKINKSLTFMVRHLEPTPHGLPIEIYAFSSDQEWLNYENIQSDIFDHILASSKIFYVQIYQNLSIIDKEILKNKIINFKNDI